MKPIVFVRICVLFVPVCVGCHTVNPQMNTASQGGSIKEMTSALGTVAQAVSGVPLDEKKMKALVRDIEKDPQAQSAVKTITDSMSSPRAIKYCPVCGRRYAPTFTHCPEHNVPLLELTE